MTKEELIKLSRENLRKSKQGSLCECYDEAFIKGYELSKKRIAELEEKISVLLSCKKCPENKGGWVCAKEYENKCLAQKIEYIKELQEENAELKEKKIKGCYFGKDELGNDFFAKCDCVDCQKRTIALLDLRKEYLNKINKEKTISEQLTNAKEIIKEFMKYEINEYDGSLEMHFEELKKQAEQFLKDSEEEK